MPSYEYRCPNGHVTTLIRPIEARHEPHLCVWPVGEGEPTEIGTRYNQCNEPAFLVPSVAFVNGNFTPTFHHRGKDGRSRLASTDGPRD